MGDKKHYFEFYIKHIKQIKQITKKKQIGDINIAVSYTYKTLRAYKLQYELVSE